MENYFSVGRTKCEACGKDILVAAQPDEEHISLRLPDKEPVFVNISEQTPTCPSCGQDIQYELDQLFNG